MRHPPSLLSLSFAACLAMALPACAAQVAPTGTASEAAAETPLQAANRLYLASRGTDFGTQPDTMAPTLRNLMERDHACASEAGVCEIGMDPWLAGGGQEGGVEGTPRFEALADGPLQARVRMRYVYAWDDARKEPQTTCILLARETADVSWQLADLMPACDETRSLLGMLRQAYPDVGTR